MAKENEAVNLWISDSGMSDKFWTGRKFWILKHLNNIIMHGVVY